MTDQPIRRQAGSEATSKEASDLVSWLTAQLDHDQAHAEKDLWALNRATPGRWEALYGYNLPHSILRGEGGVEIARFVAETGPLADGADNLHAADLLLVARLVHKARERAEQVLRQVAAYRRILSRHEGLHRCEGGDFDGGPYGPCEPARDLASIYSDHPGFDPSWTVE